MQSRFTLSNRGFRTKVILLLFLLSVLKLSANGFAQNITITVKNTPLVKVMQTIQEQSGIPFLFSGRDIANTPIDLELNSVPLEAALSEITKSKPLTWVIEDRTIVIRKKEEVPMSKQNKQTASRSQQSLFGVVTNEQGHPIQGASVVIKATNQGTTTDERGEFNLETHQRPVSILISYIGYLSAELTIEDQQTVHVTLQESLGDLEEVVVVGYGTQKKKLTTGATIQVKGDDLQKLSTPNIMEALQSQSPLACKSHKVQGCLEKGSK